jgi:hypothetical protein
MPKRIAASVSGFWLRMFRPPCWPQADRGIYTTDVIAPVPAGLKTKYFLRSRDRTSDQVRVAPELRRTSSFAASISWMPTMASTEKADAIFCRNVIIYFDRPTQERILGKLAHHLAPGDTCLSATPRRCTICIFPSFAGGSGALQESGCREPEEPLPEIYVQPGESHLVSEPTILRTVLGSCVGIAFLIPRWASARCAIPCCRPTRETAGGQRALPPAAVMWTLPFAIWPASLHALGALRRRRSGQAVRRRRRAAGHRRRCAADRRETQPRDRSTGAGGTRLRSCCFQPGRHNGHPHQVQHRTGEVLLKRLT